MVKGGFGIVASLVGVSAVEDVSERESQRGVAIVVDVCLGSYAW